VNTHSDGRFYAEVEHWSDFINGRGLALFR